jgi:hypothetical protein
MKRLGSDERFGSEGRVLLLFLCKNKDKRRPDAAASPVSLDGS